MDKPYQVIPAIDVLPAHFPLPGVGVLPINAFVIKTKEPVLVDTGMRIDCEEFMKALESVVDPHDLKWVWLTHDDADHTGSLQKVLEAAPNARLVGHAFAMLRTTTVWQAPMQRMYWLNPGEGIDVGDRRLIAVRPPLFDNPTTIGIYDNKSQTLLCADCFGAVIPSPVQYVDDVPEADLVAGMIDWASGDSPWIHWVEPGVFNRELDLIRHMAPQQILSSHLPPAQGRAEKLLEILAKVPASTPSVAPNQAVLEQLLTTMRGGS